jgi:hypothetical protein
MTTEPSAIVQRAAAVIKEAAEFTPYWVADKPETHQDPWTNAAQALEAQGMLIAPPEQGTDPRVGDKVVLHGEVISRNTIGKWVGVQFPSGGLACINMTDLDPPAPAQPWILLVCGTGNTNLMPSAVYRRDQAKWDAVGWVQVGEWPSRNAVPGQGMRYKLKREVMAKQGWTPCPGELRMTTEPLAVAND